MRKEDSDGARLGKVWAASLYFREERVSVRTTPPAPLPGLNVTLVTVKPLLWERVISGPQGENCESFSFYQQNQTSLRVQLRERESAGPHGPGVLAGDHEGLGQAPCSYNHPATLKPGARPLAARRRWAFTLFASAIFMAV